MSETRGVFGLEDIIEQKLENEWVPLEDVWNGDPAVRFSDGAQETPNTGYFGAGFNPSQGVLSQMDKVTYSSDTTAAVPSANSTVARFGLAATGNSDAGYFGGGDNPSGWLSLMDKVTYSSDTSAAVPSANLTVARRQLAATGNSTAGYFGGGRTPSTTAQMDKVTYASDTTAAVPGANLSAARYGLAASSSRANALPTIVLGPVPVIV